MYETFYNLIEKFTNSKDMEDTKNAYNELISKLNLNIDISNIDFNNTNKSKLVNILIDNCNTMTEEIKICLLIYLFNLYAYDFSDRVLPYINDKDLLINTFIDYGNTNSLSRLPDELETIIKNKIEIKKAEEEKIKEQKRQDESDKETLRKIEEMKYESAETIIKYGTNSIIELYSEKEKKAAIENYILPILNAENMPIFRNYMNSLIENLNNNDEIKLEIIKKILEKINLAMLENTSDEIKSNLIEIKYALFEMAILQLNNPKYIYDILTENNVLKDYLDEKRFVNGTWKAKVIKGNIEEILKYHGYNNIEEKKEYLYKMGLETNEIYDRINLNILNDKYTNLFTPHELNLLVCSIAKSGEKSILNLSDKGLMIIKYLKKCSKDSENFMTELANILFNMENYSELIDNIDYSSITEEEIEKIIKMLNYPNFLNIKNIEDLYNIDKLLETKVNDTYKHEDVIDCICFKRFGMNYNTTRHTYNSFKLDLDKHEELKEIAEIVEIIDNKCFTKDKLKELFNSINTLKAVPTKSKNEIYNKFKFLYENEYNNILFKKEEARLIEEKDEVKIYDADTNFHILMTAKSPFSKEKVDFYNPNYAEDWNRKDINSSIFCASFISNEMLGMVSSPEDVYYGFSKIKKDSLRIMGRSDIQSRSDSLNIRSNILNTFYHPKDLINETGYNLFLRTDFYNEVDINRNSNDKKTQPDFLISFKVGDRTYGNKAIEISKQFKEIGIDVPIVRIDVDKCLQKGIEEINNLTLEYEKNPNYELLKKIWIKFHNNSVTYNRWCKPSQNNFQDFVKLPSEIKDNLKISFHEIYETKKSIQEHGLNANLKFLYNEFNKKYKKDNSLPILDFEERKNYIIKNNLLDENNKIVEELKEVIQNSNSNLLKLKIKLTNSVEISIEEFLNNYVKYNLINGEIVINNEITSLKQYIESFYNMEDSLMETIPLTINNDLESEPQEFHM